jgi:hypothetical protein
MRFLSDGESQIFVEKFLHNRNLDDFALRIKLESSSKQRGHLSAEGTILHHRVGGSSSYYVEITDGAENVRKFLLGDEKIIASFSKNFGRNEPLIAGGLFTPNSILLPFLNPNCHFKYSGPKKVCGRTTQQFAVRVDCDILGPDVKYARLSIDPAFFQALEIEYLDGRQKLLSRQRVLSLCKRGDCWQPKTLELLDAVSRERSKITIVDSNFGPELDGMLHVFQTDFFPN